MSHHTFTPDQIADFVEYERVRRGGRYNMFEPRLRAATGLSWEDYVFVMDNYSALKDAATSPERPAS